MANRRGKKYQDRVAQVDREASYQAGEAMETLKGFLDLNFDETVEVAYTLNVDPRHSGQTVRGVVVLPHGTGKTVRVAVVASGEPAEAAQEAGADVVGSDDLIQKIQDGWLEFETLIATPDQMKSLRPLGKVLGPRGLMPNPKAGTVTEDTGTAVKEAKGGRVEYRNDRSGVVHGAIGKRSFTAGALVENAKAFHRSILNAKPDSVKGNYVLDVTASATMSPGITIDVRSLA